MIPGARALWAELRWSAGNEAVVHLDDLLLRRTRLGLLLEQGGLIFADRIEAICREELVGASRSGNRKSPVISPSGIPFTASRNNAITLILDNKNQEVSA